MARFPMCPDCDREYHDIENRRYHAQPDCCPVCGPRVFFLDGEGREVPGDPIETARAWLKAGKILAVKGLGGVHLACLADDPTWCGSCGGGRSGTKSPLPSCAGTYAAAEQYCLVSEKERAVLESFRKPIVLLKKRDKRPSPLSENGFWA